MLVGTALLSGYEGESRKNLQESQAHWSQKEKWLKNAAEGCLCLETPSHAE